MSFPSRRPDEPNFRSGAVESVIDRVTAALADDPELAWMFANCFPNTLDAAVDFRIVDGKPDTFVVAGDIDAMWLRDSAAQVWPYLQLAARDEHLAGLIAGVINRHTRSILLDPYANAFSRDGEGTRWSGDNTEMRPGVHERKWELDSLCYSVRLSHGYWKATGDHSPFDDDWREAMELVLKTMREQQRLDGAGPYRFTRDSDRPIDTLVRNGLGPVAKPCGLIVSSFRPSDDRCELPYNVPANLFAVAACRRLAEMAEHGLLTQSVWSTATSLAIRIRTGLEMEAVTTVAGNEVWSYECDAMGGHVMADDPNLPNLLGLPHLDLWPAHDPRYVATRNWVLSHHNPYFAEGSAAAGLSSPHQGADWIWPLAIITRGLTSGDPGEIRECLDTLKATHAGTGLMHESFHKNDAAQFTRPWFGRANSLFAELVLTWLEIGPEQKSGDVA